MQLLCVTQWRYLLELWHNSKSSTTDHMIETFIFPRITIIPKKSIHFFSTLLHCWCMRCFNFNVKAKASTEREHLKYYEQGRKKNTTGPQGVCESHCLVYWANGLKSKGVIDNWEYAFSSEKRAVCFPVHRNRHKHTHIS